MNHYMIKTKFKSVRTGSTCFVDIPVIAVDALTARSAAADFIMSDEDHPAHASQIQMKTLIRVLPRKESE